ncbi:competence protein ComK [Virgibacillus sp. W0430]|uniref:competence protein ComK n=1 Tax=Virgibacillus sp. W0430 TaxID=3391580 RepID=UPI003F4768C0
MSAVFIISRRTKAIAASESTYYRSIIFEGNTVRKSTHSPEKILDNSCTFYGASLAGRKETAVNILKSSSKLPVAVIPSQGVYMIPTASPRKNDCIYVSYFHIKSYESRENQTFICFTDQSGLLVNISANSFDKQYKKASQLIVHYHRDVIYRKEYMPMIEMVKSTDKLIKPR